VRPKRWLLKASTQVTKALTKVNRLHVLCSDTSADVPAEVAIEQFMAIVREDKKILERLHPDTPLDVREQQHMASDEPGIMMRRKLLSLLDAHGEREVCHA
jgi:hypothetical protein